jgi:hypothetical protein
MKKMSIVGEDYHTDEQVVGYYNAGDRMKYWGKLGAFWGGILGMLFGAAFFVIPGLGPILVAGPLESPGSSARWKARLWWADPRPGAVQHRHSQGQRCEIRDGAQVRQVPAVGS